MTTTTATKRFIAYVKGQGEGCDYTIGCNQRLHALDATDLDAARAETLALMPAWTPRDCDTIAAARIVVYEVAGEWDLAAELRAKVEADKAADAEARRAVKVREIERLQREIGAA